MNPIPVSWCAGGIVGAALLGAWGGWTVRDWKRDSEVLGELRAAITMVDGQRQVIDKAADAYEKDRVNDLLVGPARDTEIRTIYRDRVVSLNCAADPAVARVLGAALADANARAAGQPAPGLSTPPPAAEPAARP